VQEEVKIKWKNSFASILDFSEASDFYKNKNFRTKRFQTWEGVVVTMIKLGKVQSSLSLLKKVDERKQGSSYTFNY
jgi:hypothetical protein